MVVMGQGVLAASPDIADVQHRHAALLTAWIMMEWWLRCQLQ